MSPPTEKVLSENTTNICTRQILQPCGIWKLVNRWSNWQFVVEAGFCISAKFTNPQNQHFESAWRSNLLPCNVNYHSVGAMRLGSIQSGQKPFLSVFSCARPCSMPLLIADFRATKRMFSSVGKTKEREKNWFNSSSESALKGSINLPFSTVLCFHVPTQT